MAQRGRKSAAQQAIKPVLAFTRRLPQPPPELTETEAETWRAVAGSPAGNMIDASNYPLLVQFCREVAAAGVVAKLVHEFQPEWVRTDGGLERLTALLRAQDRCSRAIASLSGKLRLSPSSRVHRETAGRLVADNAHGEGWLPPWEFK